MSLKAARSVFFHALCLCYSSRFLQEHKVLLTGTPLQNSVEELFSLLNFLEPLQFPSESTFLEEFGDLKTDEQVSSDIGWLLP